MNAPLRERRRGEAHRRHANGCRLPRSSVGWVGGVYPSAQLKARTAASDGHNASTRAARSAGLNFAVILLSKAMNVGRDHLIHRKRSPFPYEGKDLTRLKVGETVRSGATLRTFSGFSLQLTALREGDRVSFSPHPPLRGPPSPRGEGLNALDIRKPAPMMLSGLWSPVSLTTFSIEKINMYNRTYQFYKYHYQAYD